MINQIITATKPLRYAWSAITYPKHRMAAELEKWRNVFEGKPLLVIGNGPSLNETPLDSFLNVPSIGMNKIDLIYNRTNWRPSLVVCVNNLVVKQGWNNFLNSDVPVYLSWKSRRFIPASHRNKFQYFLSLNSNSFSQDIVAGIGSSSTVTYTALQFAYFTGANPIILFGVDHYFNDKGKPNKIERRKDSDMNHFDNNYFASGQYWCLPDLDQSEIDYQLAKIAFENAGRKILDATIDGKLEIFEKISVSDAHSICQSQQ